MSKKNKIVILSTKTAFLDAWAQELKNKAPDMEVEVYPYDTHREDTNFVLSFFAPEGAYKKFPNLKIIASMGAGVGHIINRPDLPEGVTVTKANDPLHKWDMAVFTLGLVLNHTKNLMIYVQQKADHQWKPHSYMRPEETCVGILGFGAIGQEVGKLLHLNGFKVSGWSRSQKNIEGITSYYGENQRDAFLKKAQILICVLPLTSETKGILNNELFKKLPKGAYIINIGRGGQLVDEDLETAIANGQLSGAALDVFHEEPLPENHPFWDNDNIMITPHCAGVTDPKLVLNKVLRNYYAFQNDEDLIDIVDLSRGY